MTATPPMDARPAVARVSPASSRSVVVFPAPFGPSSPNTDPAGTVIVERIEGEDAARVALGEAVDQDRRRVGIRTWTRGGRRDDDGPRRRLRRGDDRWIVRAPPTRHRARSRRLRLDGAVLATDQEVEDRPDHADEHDDHGPYALAPAADGAVVAEEVDDCEHQEPDLDDREGDDEQEHLRRQGLEPVDVHRISIAFRGGQRHGEPA